MGMAIPVLAIVAWGAMAFGAVYDWAYGPLLILCPAVGAWGLLRTVPGARRSAVLAFLPPLLLVVAAIGAQLIPLQRAALTRLSPATDRFLLEYDVGYAFGAIAEAQDPPAPPLAHPLSVNPSRTAVGLAFAAALGIYLAGLTRGMDGRDLRILAHGITVLGTALAIVAIVQKAMWNGRLYGFWQPEAAIFSAFGPFVNRNHFAGWMLMAMPTAIAGFTSSLDRGITGARRDWRSWTIWLSSRAANRAVLAGAAVVVMGLALTMTLSRSGITCLLMALLMSGRAAARRGMSPSRSRIVTVYLAIVFLAVMAWTGAGLVADRFSGVGWNLGDRGVLWADAWRIHRMFPIAGTGLNTFGTATTLLTSIDRATHYAEAHNDYAQLLAEGGLLVVVPAALLVAVFVLQVRARFREERDDATGYWLRVGAVTGIVAVAVQEIVDFSLQMPGNAVLFVTLCAVAARRTSRPSPADPSPDGRSRGWAPAVLAALAVAAGGGAACGGAAPTLPVVQGEYATDTGRLLLLTYDTDGDGRADVRCRMAGARLQSIDIDANADGTFERREVYTAAGTLESVRVLEAGDGRPEAWTQATTARDSLLSRDRRIVEAAVGVPAVRPARDAGGSR
jgi:O-antigen ligase